MSFIQSPVCFVDVGQIEYDDQNNPVKKEIFEVKEMKREPTDYYSDLLSVDNTENGNLRGIDICKTEELDIKYEPINKLSSCYHSAKLFPKIQQVRLDHVKNNLKSYTCDYCNRTFMKRRYLLRHIRIHTGEKPYVCRFCTKAFVHDHSLIRHLKLHTGERPFTCLNCQRVFISKNELRRHMFTHTGEKPYVCVHCNKAFNRLSTLNSHMKIHKCVRPFKCSYCGKAFRENRYLKRHLKGTEDRKPGSCSICYAQLFSNLCFNYHECIHSFDKFLCDHCDRIFLQKNKLIEHILKHFVH